MVAILQLNGDELQFLVDNLFIGDKLTRNLLQSTTALNFRCPQRHLADHCIHLDGRQHQSTAADTRLDSRSVS